MMFVLAEHEDTCEIKSHMPHIDKEHKQFVYLCMCMCVLEAV